MDESDKQRFERLYELHFKRVAAYLLARSGPDLAADALSRTFEVAWRRIGSPAGTFALVSARWNR